MATGFDAPAGAREEPGRLVAGRRTRHSPPTGLVAAADLPGRGVRGTGCGRGRDGPVAPPRGLAQGRGCRSGTVAGRVVRRRFRRAVLGRPSVGQAAGDHGAHRPAGIRKPAAAARGRRDGERAGGCRPGARRWPGPGRGRRAAGESTGSYPPPSAGAADQTLIQPAQAATGPAPVATQPYRARLSLRRVPPSRFTPLLGRFLLPPQSARAATPASPCRCPAGACRHTLPAATQPTRGARHQAGADDDPLTSPAYSLRRQGSVDGHSSLAPAEARHSDGRPDGYLPGGYGSGLTRCGPTEPGRARRPPPRPGRCPGGIGRASRRHRGQALRRAALRRTRSRRTRRTRRPTATRTDTGTSPASALVTTRGARTASGVTAGPRQRDLECPPRLPAGQRLRRALRPRGNDRRLSMR